MAIVTQRHLTEAADRYPEAASELRSWSAIVPSAGWRNFPAVRQIFPDADAVDGYVAFNIRRNRYRLITVIHYAREIRGGLTRGHVYIRSFLTHREYEVRSNWDRRFGR